MKKYVKSLFTPTAIRQLVKVGMVGVVNTIVSFTLFNIFLKVLGGTKTVDEGFNWEQFWSIALSFAIATLVSYALNRRWTFELSEGGDVRRETMHFFAINLGAMGVTQFVVNSADWVWGPLSLLQQNLFYLLAAVLIIVPKFAGYRDIVFRRAIDAQAEANEKAETVTST
jgi:putative flippase GtrA